MSDLDIRDIVTGIQSPAKGSDEALLVKDILSGYGYGDTLKLFVLKTTTATGVMASTPVYPTYKDNCAAKAIYIFPVSVIPALPDALLVGWTTTNGVSGATEIKTVHDGLETKIATPGTAAPPVYNNTIIISSLTQPSYDFSKPIVTADAAEDNLIQTIGVTSLASGDIKVIIGIVQ